MKPILFADEMKRIDSYTINKIGIEGCVLMERAALFVVETIRQYISEHNISNPQIAILCGNGNNGGDGFAVARILWEEDYNVSIVAPFIQEKKSADNLKQLQIINELGLSVNTTFEKEEYDIMIDALFGIGLNRPLEGKYADVVAEFNSRTGYKIAVDIPSGLHTDTGMVMGCCIKADCTVTMQYEKVGLYVGMGREYTGTVLCKNIGIHNDNIPFRMFAHNDTVSQLLPLRTKTGNKGTFGKVLIIAGEKDMAGACILCAKAAFRSGCGMVKIITVPQNREIIQTALPEAMLFTTEYDEEAAYDKVTDSIKWADSMVIGPGMGRNAAAASLLKHCILNADIPMVLDADALWLLAKCPEVKELLQNKEHIVTPHIGEFSLMTGVSCAEIKSDICERAMSYSKANSGILVLKDATTIISDRNHSYQMINTVGNDGMATAGSGDVLAGIIGSHLAGGMGCFEAASLGVYRHGMAGDLVAKKKNKSALMANDIIENLGNGVFYD